MYSVGHLGRRIAQRNGVMLTRAYSTEASRTGRVLTDEERAAESMYIKKMEHERLEKLKKAQHSPSAHTEEATSPSSRSGTEGATAQKATDSSTSVAVFGGLSAVALGGYFFLRTEGKKEEKD
ncbi:hypothetical protein CBR_g38024 [Chara braunii]|uniref:Copper ion binding protein n=1 Tax=Chara braunii TaxID=69332 RepID=A0A388K008_CHABU|nr:hypothetical protein CBR_g38024 [Chara braunii]|eukprot:GBG63401.1 hypothetical protein CBR_g38024 [Chara braunii]